MRKPSIIAAPALVLALSLVSCASGSTTNTSPRVRPTGTPILPVKDNPISNTSTTKALVIDSVKVEDNVDAAGKDVSDHLEVAVSNTGATDLGGIEIFYTFTDPKAKLSESYYVQLLPEFTIPAGGRRVVHFDNSGAPDHYQVSEFSLYKTSKKALEVSVIVSAKGAAVETSTVKKDAGGAETAD